MQVESRFRLSLLQPPVDQNNYRITEIGIERDLEIIKSKQVKARFFNR